MVVQILPHRILWTFYAKNKPIAAPIDLCWSFWILFVAGNGTGWLQIC